MAFQAYNDDAHAFTPTHDDCGIARVGVGARRTHRHDRIEGWAGTGTTRGHLEPGPQRRGKYRVELVERPPADLDLEKDTGDGVGQPLRVMAVGGTLMGGTTAAPPARACGPCRASQLETPVLDPAAGRGGSERSRRFVLPARPAWSRQARAR